MDNMDALYRFLSRKSSKLVHRNLANIYLLESFKMNQKIEALSAAVEEQRIVNRDLQLLLQKR